MKDMDKTLDYIRWALSEALDASAPDRDSWINGESVFWQSIRSGATLEDALKNALDASAPDGDSWINGWNAFWPDNPRLGLDRFKQLVNNLLKNDA